MFLNTPFTNPREFNVPTGYKLLLNKKEEYTYNALTGAITGATGSTWTDFEDLTINYSATVERTRAGTRHIIEISFQLPQVSTPVNTLYSRFREDVSGIVTDSNGKSFLIGNNQPLNCTRWELDSETGGYQITLSTAQLAPPIEIRDEIVSGLERSTLENCDYNLSGIETVWFLDRSHIVGLIRESAIIIETTLLEDFDWNLYENLHNIRYAAAAQLSRNETIYDITLSFEIDKIRAESHALIAPFCDANLSAVVEDSNGKLWLIGYKEPLTITDIAYNSSAAMYSYALRCRSRNAPLEIVRAQFSEIVESGIFDYTFAGMFN